MRIPSPSNAAGSVLDFRSLHQTSTSRSIHGSLPKREDWSSLIGIVTAICGNVLISIALNTQRYAHIKLNEQYAERQRLLKQAKRRAAGQQNHYGTERDSLHKEQMKRRSNGRSFTQEEGESSETEPLLSSSYSSAREQSDHEADEPFDEEVAQKSYLKSPWWWAGIIMMTTGEAGNFLAYGFAPASIVSPLGVVALISNCVIAPFFLKEPFRKRDLLGVIIAVAGAVTVVLSASDSNPKLGPHEIWKLIGTWEFETYLGITIALIISLMWASSRYGGKSIFIDIGLVGLFGGYTALSTKGVASMLSYTLFKALTFPVTYLLLAVLILTAVMQIKYVNRALKNFDATEVIPTQFVMFTLSVIIGSAVLYRDFEKESAQNAGKFVGGCVMTFLGVYLITSARNRESDEEEAYDDNDDEDETILLSGQAYHDAEPFDESTSRRPSAVLATTPERAEPSSPLRFDVAQYDSHHNGSTSMPVVIEPNKMSSPRDPEPTFLGSADYTPSKSMAEPSPLADNIWISPEEQSATARRSMLKLLRPLSKLFPQQDAQTLPNTLKSTHSTPNLPTEAQLGSTQTPPSLPVQDEQDLTPMTPHALDGSHVLSRHSISDLIPGPLTSTLSSPLSAIVADSLRRGVDANSLKPKRRKRLPGLPRVSGLRKRRNSEADSQIDAIRDGSSSNVSTDLREANPPQTSTSRGRSLSNTFGDFFRVGKKPRRESQTESTEPSAPPTPPGH